MSAIDLVKQTAHLKRRERINAVRIRAEEEDSRSTYAVSFAGYSRGRAIGRLPGGRTVAIEAASNGGLLPGQVIVASIGRGRQQETGHWMTR